MGGPGRLFQAVVLSIIAIGGFSSCEKDDPEDPGEGLFDRISGFVISDGGTKLLATDRGLYSLNEENGKYEFLESDMEHTPLNDLAWSPTVPVKALWLASDNGAYNFTSKVRLTKDNSGLHNNVIRHLLFDGGQVAYFASPGGLSIQKGPDWSFYTGLDSLYRDFEVTDIGVTTNGYTYVTTLGGGIERFKMDVDGISGATIFDTDWTYLESNNIHSVYIDDTVQAYGTDLGAAIHISEYTKRDWSLYTTSEGLINDTVLAIARDHSDHWWFGTARGISRYDGSGWTSFSKETDQLPGNRIRFMALDTDGSVWSASDEGLSHFAGEQWISYPKQPTK
jgi:ligand-binding sensor domain-containing protein